MKTRPVRWDLIVKEKQKLTQLNTTLSPLQTFKRLREKNSVFLNSAGENKQLTRYSIIALNPEIIFKVKDGFTKIKTNNGKETKTGNPFDILKKLYEEKRQRFFDFPSHPTLHTLPFIGGPIGFFSYDSNQYIEKLPSKATDDLLLSDMYFIFPKTIITFDNKENKTYLIYSSDDDKNSVIKKLNSPRDDISFNASEISTNMSEDYFKKAINKIVDYIYDGDVYQVNFSQRFESNFQGDPLSLYERLCEINPSPFSAYIETDNEAIISSSPERLIQLKNDDVQTRPIAGTRRRGRDSNEDKHLSGHLLLDEKEKAEHIMLVDLERNDIGKVCSYGSVHCSELMTIEKYSHVIHIVSNVKGKLNPTKNAIDLIRATFPGGTITGCPKVRCMEIIEELEPTKRGPYTGSIGYISYNNSIDLNIIIRTFLCKNNKLYFQAGAGIVADSTPEREYFETISKANALFQAIGISPKEVKWEQMSS